MQWETASEEAIYHGLHIEGDTVLSTLDMALWDALGKAAGQPVVRLLGGGDLAHDVAPCAKFAASSAMR